MPSHAEPLPRLTSREREVADLIVQGLSSTAIAVKLGLSPHTVRKHRANLMGRLRVRHRAQLAALLGMGQAGAASGPNARRPGR